MEEPRVRVKTRACDACHKRKIQCDAAPSQCNWCKHHGLVCTFNRPFGRRKRKGEIAYASVVNEARNNSSRNIHDKNATSLANTVDGLSTISSPSDADTFVDPSKQTLHDSTAKVANTLPYSGLGGFYFDGFHFGGLSSDNGIPFLSEEGEKWIQARTESAFASLKLHPRARWVQGEQGLKFSSCVDGTWQLPERSIVEIYFSIFCKSSKRYVFPIIDEFSFMDIVDRAYDARRNLECLEVIRAKACVLSFTSVMVHMEGKLDMHKSVDADQCAARVHRLMPQILAEATSESLQVCTMLCMYNIFAGNTKVAATFLSIACRFVFMLGAHMNPSDEEPTTSSTENARPTRHYLRRIFWHCYMYDKDICLRVGYPPMIDDDHCDLTLPPGYKQIDEFESFKDSRDHIPGDMRLTIIKSRVIKLLYCANAFRKSDAELLKDIRELDDELESWRTSLPQQYRPNLATSYRMNPDPVWNKSKKVHIIVIQLEYYFLLALIHSASGRCRAWVPSEMGHRTSVTSSQAIALQASRSTLVNLEAVAHVLNRGDFWFFVLYPISASLTIFCNLLLSPLNSQAKEDIQLLQSVPALIKGMHTQLLIPKDGVLLEQIEDFVVELRRLANCAMKKAYREQDKTNGTY